MTIAPPRDADPLRRVAIPQTGDTVRRSDGTQTRVTGAVAYWPALGVFAVRVVTGAEHVSVRDVPVGQPGREQWCEAPSR